MSGAERAHRLPDAPTVHDLKCQPPGYGQIAAGVKPFELRYDDRGYRIGDVLHLREYDPRPDVGYTGFACDREVTFILRRSLQYPVPLGWVVLGLRINGTTVDDGVAAHLAQIALTAPQPADGAG